MQCASDSRAVRKAESTLAFTTKEVAVRRFRLTNTAKAFSALVVAGVVSLTFYCNPGLLKKVAPSASTAQQRGVQHVDPLPGEMNRAGAETSKACDGAEQRRLSGTVGSDQCYRLTPA